MIVRMVFFLSILLLVAIVHAVSIQNFLYWKYLWLDIPMHFLGGIACTFGFSLIPPFFHLENKRWGALSSYLLFVVFVGASWEVFEFVAGISIVEPGYTFDTVKDMVMDLCGGLFAYFLIRRLDLLSS